MGHGPGAIKFNGLRLHLSQCVTCNVAGNSPGIATAKHKMTTHFSIEQRNVQMRQFVSRAIVAIMAVLAFAVSAEARDCKTDAVTASGSPAATQLIAYPSSLMAWRNAVRDKHGAEWNSWRYAQDRDVDCQRQDGKWLCTRIARPCQDTLSTITDGEKITKKRQCKDDSLSSYGRRERNEEEAANQSTWGWRIDARKKYGSDWAEWDNASDKDIDCRKKGSRYQCVAVATACLPE